MKQRGVEPLSLVVMATLIGQVHYPCATAPGMTTYSRERIVSVYKQSNMNGQATYRKRLALKIHKVVNLKGLF